MKKAVMFFVFGLFALLFFPSWALKAQSSVLHLQMFDQSAFSLVLDDVHFKDIRTSYTIKNVPPGTHLLWIVQPKKNRRVGKVIFKDYIRIPDNREIFAYIDSELNFRVHDAIPIKPETAQAPRPDDPYLRPQQQQQQQTAPTPNTRPNTNQPTAQTAPPPPAPGMKEADFTQLRNTIKDQDYDDTRIQIAKDAITKQPLNCQQLAELLDVFSFESGKLVLAKFAYSYLTDKEQFSVVIDRFKLNNSRKELEKMASGK